MDNNDLRHSVSATNLEVIEVNVKDALVTITHEDRNDVLIEAEDVDAWKISGGTTEAFSIVQRTILRSVTGKLHARSGGVRIGGDGTILSGARRGLDDELFIQDTKWLRIAVPIRFKQSLTLTMDNMSSLRLDGWHGGSVNIAAFGGSHFDTGALNDLESAVFHSSSAAFCRIAKVISKSTAISYTGCGGFHLKELTTLSLLLTHCGTGMVILNGVIAQSAHLIGSDKGASFVQGVIAKLIEQKVKPINHYVMLA